jgi:hypothetical protein
VQRSSRFAENFSGLLSTGRNIVGSIPNLLDPPAGLEDVHQRDDDPEDLTEASGEIRRLRPPRQPRQQPSKIRCVAGLMRAGLKVLDGGGGWLPVRLTGLAALRAGEPSNGRRVVLVFRRPRRLAGRGRSGGAAAAAAVVAERGSGGGGGGA